MPCDELLKRQRREAWPELKPLYLRLTDRDLLLRCARGATQNASECYNGILWGLCPKTSFCGPAAVETAVCLAVCLFNHGGDTIKAVLQAMNCDTGSYLQAGLASSYAERLYHSARKCGKEKAARKRRRAVKKGLVDDESQREGITYSAGGF